MRLTILLFLMFASAAHAQTSLRVIVSDASTGAALNAAVVTLTRPNGSVVRAETDTAGFASFTKLSGGAHTIAASAIGYETSTAREIQIEAETFTDLNITLKPAPIGLDPVEATVAAEPGRSPDLVQSGFYNRMKFNNGIFIDRAEIEERNQRYLSELIRSKPGINVRPGPGGENLVWFRGSEGIAMSGGIKLCGPAVFIDGSLAYPASEQPTPIDRLLATNDIAGIEIYRRPSQIPQQFSGATAGCGIILLWTRLRS